MNQRHEYTTESTTITLHLIMDEQIGIYRVYIEGDAAIKPLYSGLNLVAAQQVFDDTRKGMMARANAGGN